MFWRILFLQHIFHPKLIVNLDMFELSYRFQTLHKDSYISEVQFRRHSNSIIINRKSVRPFKHADFSVIHPIRKLLKYWFLGQLCTMLLKKLLHNQIQKIKNILKHYPVFKQLCNKFTYNFVYTCTIVHSYSDYSVLTL